MVPNTVVFYWCVSRLSELELSLVDDESRETAFPFILITLVQLIISISLDDLQDL